MRSGDWSAYDRVQAWAIAHHNLQRYQAQLGDARRAAETSTIALLPRSVMLIEQHDGRRRGSWQPILPFVTTYRTGSPASLPRRTECWNYL